MLRKITKQTGRWKAGVLHDWPLATWVQLARDAGMSLDEFSQPEEMDKVLSARNRAGARIRSRAQISGRAGAH